MPTTRLPRTLRIADRGAEVRQETAWYEQELVFHARPPVSPPARRKPHTPCRSGCPPLVRDDVPTFVAWAAASVGVSTTGAMLRSASLTVLLTWSEA